MEPAMDLYEAIAAGNEAAALEALDAQPRPPEEQRRPTPVLWALYHGHRDLARTLAGRIGHLDLAEAAALDDAPRVRQLLDSGEPVDGRTPDGYTPLQLAAFFGGSQAAVPLLERGADPGAVAGNPMRIQPLHAAGAGRLGAQYRQKLSTARTGRTPARGRPARGAARPGRPGRTRP